MADTHRIRFEPVDIEMEVTEDDKILDAAVDDKGGVEFLLVPQPGTGRENGTAPAH